MALLVTMRQWFEIAYLVIPSGIVGTLLWNYGSQHLPGAATGAFLYFIPVVVFCGALMLAGVAIAQFGASLFGYR